MAGKNWTWEETLMAFALYYLLPAREVDKSGSDVKALAAALGRTPSSVALKAWNISAHDQNRVESGRVGLKHGSKLDALVWEEFAARGDELIDEALQLLTSALGASASSPNIQYALIDIQPEGSERVVQRTERVNQQYFRNTLLRNYSDRCCITGIAVPELLVASHIKPWRDSDAKTERLAANNGLLLNALHDRAFDQGLMTINSRHEVVLSPRLKRDAPNIEWLYRVEGKQITEPSVMPPAKEFIEYHNDVIFQR